jgi:hypothetical protein
LEELSFELHLLLSGLRFELEALLAYVARQRDGG